MTRLQALSRVLLRAAQGSSKNLAAACCSAGALEVASQQVTSASKLQAAVAAFTSFRSHSFHSSTFVQDKAPTAGHGSDIATEIVVEPPRKYRDLSDKELWHEAWMYEEKFGTPEDPIFVPSTEPERIIGVIDPEDDCTIIWGLLKETEPPRQLYEGGEYYALIRVDFIKRVGDVLEELEKSGAAPAKSIAK